MERRPTRGSRKFTREELKLRCTPDDAVIIINNRAYDVTSLLADHPGGEKVLLEQAGRDATIPFELANHSAAALSLMETYQIGKLVKADCVIYDPVEYYNDYSQDEDNERSSWLTPILLCVAIIIIYRSLLE